jgi:hypothetical protein
MTPSPGPVSADIIKHMLRSGRRIVVACAASAPLAAAAQSSQSECPAPSHEFGLLDYRTQKGALAAIERVHFTRRVETLVGGATGARPASDIAYILHRSPNHHRALVSLSKLSQRLTTDQVKDMRYSVTCYFDRAVRYQPEDTVSRLLFAQHLGATGRPELGRQHLAISANYAKDNPLTHYNIGLVAVELKDYARALEHAHIAYAMGVGTTGLRRQLESAGHWADLPAKQSIPTAASGTADAASGAR